MQYDVSASGKKKSEFFVHILSSVHCISLKDTCFPSQGLNLLTCNMKGVKLDDLQGLCHLIGQGIF